MSTRHKKTENPFENRIGLVYARVSTKRQEAEGHGLDSQEGRCISDLKALHVPFEKTFPDSYTGGGDFMRRPAMREMLAYIYKNRHKQFVVVFDDLKRFARDVEFHIKLRATFKARGVLLRCLNYNFEDTPEGRFVEVIMAGANELEREQNKRQVVQKMKARLDAGYWTFPWKCGYIIKKRKDHGKIAIPHPVDGPLLTEALEGFANGTFVRPVDACKYLVEKGFWNTEPAKRTEKFISILKDPFYAGLIEYPPWEVDRRQGHHKALISMETFLRNQERLSESTIKKHIRIDTSEDFPLRGLISCAECNGHLTGTWGNGRNGVKYAYYLCQTRTCSSYRRIIRRKEVEDNFRELVINKRLSPVGIRLVQKAFDEAWNEELKDFNLLRSKEKKNQIELEERISKLTELLLQTSSETLRKTYETELEKCVGQLEKAQKHPSKIDIEIPYRTALDKATTFLENPYQYWLKVNAAEKQRLFFFLFERKLAYAYKEGYRTGNNPIATRLFEDFTTAKSPNVDMRGNLLNRIKDYVAKFWEFYQQSPSLRLLLANT